MRNLYGTAKHASSQATGLKQTKIISIRLSRTNRLIVSHKDFLVMILRGPNTRLDFHIVTRGMSCTRSKGIWSFTLKRLASGVRSSRSKGRLFVCPGGLAHSPGRFENTWAGSSNANGGLGKKKSSPGFARSATRQCYRESWTRNNIPASSVPQVYQEFNNNEKLRTCRACGYVFPETPMADGRDSWKKEIRRPAPEPNHTIFVCACFPSPKVIVPVSPIG